MPATDHVHDKVILITGAGSGFGRLVATQAAARGAKLVCADVNEDTARQTAGAIRDAGGQAHAVRADVTAIDELRAAVRLALEHFGRVDVMVNNAGTMPLAFFSDHERALQAWHRCIDINININAHTDEYIACCNGDADAGARVFASDSAIKKRASFKMKDARNQIAALPNISAG